jgi:hypothetical protein
MPAGFDVTVFPDRFPVVNTLKRMPARTLAEMVLSSTVVPEAANSRIPTRFPVNVFPRTTFWTVSPLSMMALERLFRNTLCLIVFPWLPA